MFINVLIAMLSITFFFLIFFFGAADLSQQQLKIEIEENLKVLNGVVHAKLKDELNYFAVHLSLGEIDSYKDVYTFINENKILENQSKIKNLFDELERTTGRPVRYDLSFVTGIQITSNEPKWNKFGQECNSGKHIKLTLANYSRIGNINKVDINSVFEIMDIDQKIEGMEREVAEN